MMSYYKKGVFFTRAFIVIMAIPKNNREFYKIINDDNLLSAFVRDQNLAQRSDQQLCHCSSVMTDGSRKKKLKKRHTENIFNNALHELRMPKSIKCS
jgi:hypothetical protein